MRLTRLAALATVAILATPLAAEAQQPGKPVRLGILYRGSPTFAPETDYFDRGVVVGLRDHGYVVGQNLVIEFRSALGKVDPDPFPGLAAELVGFGVDVIVTTSEPGVKAAREASPTIPIVNDAARNDGHPDRGDGGGRSGRARARVGRPEWAAPDDAARARLSALHLCRGPDRPLGRRTEGTIVGFACSWMRQRFWYLGHLFICPDIQARGIGQALMSRTLEQAARTGAENRALITPGYNMASTGLYIRNGLVPREPLYRLATEGASV